MNRKNSVLSMLALLGATIFNVNLVHAVLVEDEDQQASRDLGASIPQVCFITKFTDSQCADTPGVCPGKRFTAGSGCLIENDPVRGTWIVGSAHGVIPNGQYSPVYSVAFRENALEANNNGDVTLFSPSDIFPHPSRDIVLIRLYTLARDEEGNVIPPFEYATEEPPVDSMLLFVGYGVSGTPPEADPNKNQPFDGIRRAATGRTKIPFVWAPTITYLRYENSDTTAGIVSSSDSGGALLEMPGEGYRLLGFGFELRGSGETAISGFEEGLYNSGELFTWFEDTITSSTSSPSPTPSPTPTVTPTPSPTPSPTPTQTPNAVPGDVWSLYANSGTGGFGSDGQITQGDWVAIREHLLGHPIPQGLITKADANGDGVVDIADMYVAMRSMQEGG